MTTTNTPPANITPEDIEQNKMAAQQLLEEVIFDAFCQKMASIGHAPRNIEHGVQMYQNALNLHSVQQDPRVKAAHSAQSIDDIAAEALQKQASELNLQTPANDNAYLQKAAALLGGDARIYNAAMLLELTNQPAQAAA